MFEFDKVSLKKSIIYFFVLNLFIFILIKNTSLLYSIFPNGVGKYVGFSMILIFTLIIGKSDIKKYFKKVDNSWWKTIKIGIFTYASIIFSLLIIMRILTWLDYTSFMNQVEIPSMTTKQLAWHFWGALPLNVISEEFYKILSFIGLYSLIALFVKNKKVLVILSVVLTCLAFGFLHSPNYNFMYALVIGVATIPTYIFFIKYKSVLPLIIEHFLMNFINSTSNHESYLVQSTMYTLMGTLLLFAVISLNIVATKYIYKKLTNKKTKEIEKA